VIARCVTALLLGAGMLLSTAPAHAAPAGEPRALLGLLVQFGDQTAQTTAAQWRRRLFGAGDSVRATLTGALDIEPAAESDGMPDDGIVGWLTLRGPHPDFAGAVGDEARLLAHDALVAASRHMRLADFDIDGDGVVSPGELVVVIVVAGHEAALDDACRPAVWAHHGEMAPVAVDGVQLSAYAMLGEMHCAQSSPPGAPASAEVIAHVTAALLGLVDDTADVAPPAAGEYTVVIPNGGEAWTIGSIRRMEWQSTLAGNVRVDVSRDDGVTWTTIFSSLVDDGAHKWMVTGPATNRARLRVCSVAAPSICDASDAAFVINRGTVTLQVPNGGETWPIGSIRRVEWTSTVAGKVSIELSRDAGTSWTTLFASLENDGAHNWTVTGPATSRARLRVCSVATRRICDRSNTVFTIGAAARAGANLVAPVLIVPSLTIIVGQPWVVGVVTANAGTGTAGPSRTDIYLSKDSTFTGDDLRMASFSVPALGPGEVNEQAKIITFPVISAGLYSVAARADALGAVAETDENNWFPLPTGFQVFVVGLPFSADAPAAP
jgi:hypothetical protein